MAALALAFGLVCTACDTGTNGGGFVAVTGTTGVPTAAIKDKELTLSGTVEPSNATNRTIVWTSSDVTISGGVFTATSAGDITVTAAIANGSSESGAYTRDFTITVYDAGTSTGNPFGDNTTPFYWAMDDTGGRVYVFVRENEWEALYEGETYNSGEYTRISGTKAALWTVSEGSYT